jgi:hypothetical protein
MHSIQALQKEQVLLLQTINTLRISHASGSSNGVMGHSPVDDQTTSSVPIPPCPQQHQGVLGVVLLFLMIRQGEFILEALILSLGVIGCIRWISYTLMVQMFAFGWTNVLHISNYMPFL